MLSVVGTFTYFESFSLIEENSNTYTPGYLMMIIYKTIDGEIE